MRLQGATPSEPCVPVTEYTAQAIYAPREVHCCCGFGDDSCDELVADWRPRPCPRASEESRGGCAGLRHFPVPGDRADTTPVVVGPVVHVDPAWLGFCSVFVSNRPGGLGHQGNTAWGRANVVRSLSTRICEALLALFILKDPPVPSTE